MPRAAGACDLHCSITKGLEDQRLAGAVYALVDGDRDSLGAAGFANHPARQAMRSDSKVHIGSVTKTLVALGALRLASQGRLDLDAPIEQYLLQPTIDNPWRASHPVTLRHLLDHSAGLDDLRLWQFFTTRVTPRAPLRGAFQGPAELLRARVPPGSAFSYSNMSYTLAGMVLEAVTGERYEAWLDRELLRPLGMHDSSFEFLSQAGPDADPRLAWGHFDDLELAPAQPVWLRPAAQFTTTAGDMARLMRFLMSDGRLGESAFIEENLLRQMGRPVSTDAARAGLAAGYSLGLLRRDRHGAVGLCHLGNITGFRAAMCVYPEHRKAFFIAQNSDSETAQYAQFDEMLVKALGVQTPTAPGASVSELSAWTGRYVLAPARFESFRYLDLLFDTLSLRAVASGAELQRTGAEPVALVPAGSRLFRAADRSQASHVLLGEVGARRISDGTHTWRQLSAGEFAGAWISLVLGLVGLVVLLVLIPWRAIRSREPWLQPATLAWTLLLIPVPLFALQPFMALGDLTAASGSLYLASVGLPVLMIIHGIWAWWRRARLRSWMLHVAAAAAVLQWCASLWAWDLLPLALWK